MNITYICRPVDETSPDHATQVRWITSLASKDRIEHVHVLTPRVGPARLPSNVSVHVFGGWRWPLRALPFYREVVRAQAKGSDCFLVVQGGPFPALLLPFKLVARRGIYQWKAHPHVSARMRFYARYCDDLVFTATPGSFPMKLDKLRVVGHGIDTDMFRPRAAAAPTRDLVVVGRVTPVKRLEWAVRALDECRRRFGATYTLDIVGPITGTWEPYVKSLLGLVEELGLSSSIRLLGSVQQHTLPDLLSNYRASINFSDTAFDKAAGEAMASGLPVVATNPRMVEALPPDLRRRLAAPPDDVAAQASVVHGLLSLEEAARAEIGRRLRATVVENHSLEALFDKILAAIDEDRP